MKKIFTFVNILFFVCHYTNAQNDTTFDSNDTVKRNLVAKTVLLLKKADSIQMSDSINKEVDLP